MICVDWAERQETRQSLLPCKRRCAFDTCSSTCCFLWGSFADSRRVSAPMLEVNITTQFLKLTTFPLLSVSRPSSSSCSNTLKISGCAFSLKSRIDTRKHACVHAKTVRMPAF